MKCSIMLHFIWVFTVSKITHLWRIPNTKRVNMFLNNQIILQSFSCMKTMNHDNMIVCFTQDFKRPLWFKWKTGSSSLFTET